jgi:hypothetical protein
MDPIAFNEKPGPLTQGHRSACKRRENKASLKGPTNNKTIFMRSLRIKHPFPELLAVVFAHRYPFILDHYTVT